jgi:DNA-binding MarR family transcriptional regulator
MSDKALPARRRAEAPTTERRASRLEPLNQGGLDQLIGYHLRLAQISVFRDFAEATREFDMSPGWVGLLVLIKHNPGLTQSRLAQAIGIDRSTLVNSLDRLEARRLVERSASPLDRRANVLQLTAGGEALLEGIMPLIHAHEARLKAHLGGEEALRLLQTLTHLAAFGLAGKEGGASGAPPADG